MIIPTSLPDNMAFGSAPFNAFWAAAVECEMPLTFHLSLGEWLGSRDIRMLAMCGEFPVKRALVHMLFGGVFDRFPTLKIVLAEFEVGWLPFFFWIADHKYRLRPSFTMGNYVPKLELQPSDYFKRQMWATYIEDPTALPLLDLIGEDKLMFSTDYPHVESLWPRSHEYADRIFKKLSKEARRKITRDNGASLYGFDINRATPRKSPALASRR